VGIEQRALVVEIQEKVTVAMGQVLKNIGYTFKTARNAPDAMVLYRKDRHHLVVTSDFLPGQNGAYLVQELKVIEPALPILLFCHSPSDATLVEVLAYSRFAALKKPFRPDIFEQAVRWVNNQPLPSTYVNARKAARIDSKINAQANGAVSGLVNSLSMSGLYFSSRVKTQVGQAVDILLDVQPPLTISGRVAWVNVANDNPKNFLGFAVEFNALSEAQQSALRNIMLHQLKAQSPSKTGWFGD
jgi:DNA-binding response OmpR family regulator